MNARNASDRQITGERQSLRLELSLETEGRKDNCKFLQGWQNKLTKKWENVNHVSHIMANALPYWKRWRAPRDFQSYAY